MEEILMTPDTGMQFLIWSYYYHDIVPSKNRSYKDYNKFSDADVVHLDELKDMLFKCFEEDSVVNACKQFRMAKMNNEPCPFSQNDLDAIFAKEIA